MFLARSRVLALTLIATSVVASIAWTLVLLGVGHSHAASFRLVRGVSVVLHHDDEDTRALGHVHRHHGAHHDHPAGDPHADDHVVTVSAEPASLRSQDALVALGGEWVGATVPMLAAAPMVPAIARFLPVSGGRHARHVARSTTVLLL